MQANSRARSQYGLMCSCSAVIIMGGVDASPARATHPHCCDMSQNDTIGKIELKPSFVLSSDNTNYKNDIQLVPQLFNELRVNGDCH